MAVKIPVQKQADFIGTLPTFYVPDAEGVLFLNDGQTQLVFSNSHASNANSFIVTAYRGYLGTGFRINYPAANTNESGNIPANSFTNSSFFDPRRFNRGDGRVLATFNSIANIGVAAIRVQDAAQGGLV